MNIFCGALFCARAENILLTCAQLFAYCNARFDASARVKEGAPRRSAEQREKIQSQSATIVAEARCDVRCSAAQHFFFSLNVISRILN